MKRLTRKQAVRKHLRQYFGGKHAGQALRSYHFPYEGADAFVQVRVPTKYLNATGNAERVRRYAETLRDRPMGPSWVRMSKRPAKTVGRALPGGCKPLIVVDGNHRALAAKRLRREHVTVIMPREDFERWRRYEPPPRCRRKRP